MPSFKDLNRAVKKYNADLDKVVRRSILDVTARVVRRTPVDTGRLRGNWNASLDGPNAATSEQTDKGGSATIAAASDVIKNATGRVYYFVNSLPYARKIEYEGHSKIKAPLGMVRISVAEFEQGLKAAIASVK